MSVKLRELIRAVRACKTAQEERAVIAKECALIRTAFKARLDRRDAPPCVDVGRVVWVGDVRREA